MDELKKAGTIEDLLAQALELILKQLKPERAFIAYRTDPQSELIVKAAHGIDPKNIFTTGEISLEVIKNVINTGEYLLTADAFSAPGLSNRTSVVLSGLRSILAVPLKTDNQVLGILYTDNRLTTGAFQEDDAQWASELANIIATRLQYLLKRTVDSPEQPDSTATGSDLLQLWKHERSQGIRFFKQKDYTNARHHLEKAVEIAADMGPESLALAKSWGELGELYHATGEIEKAEKLLQDSIQLFRSLGKENHSELAPSLNNLAGVYYTKGLWQDAQKLYEQALQIWQKSLPPTDGKLATVYYNLGVLSLKLGQREQAIDLLSHALKIAEQAFGVKHPYTERCRNRYQAACSVGQQE